MIVYKTWVTMKDGKKWDSFYCEGHYYHIRERHWSGYFLLGIVPLYIKNYKTNYR